MDNKNEVSADEANNLDGGLIELSLDIYMEGSNDTNYEKYHYTSITGLKGILDSNTFWFTHFKYLNDKSEREDIYDLYKKCCESLKNEGDTCFVKFIDEISNLDFETNSFNFFIDDAEKYYIKKEPVEIFVLSCSENRDSLAMWNYYSKNELNKGYNLGFNPNIFPSSINRNRTNYIHMMSGKVEYNDENKEEYLKNNILKVYEIFKRKAATIEQVIDFIKHMVNRKSLLFKSTHFEHENEYRFILTVSKKILNKENICENPEIKYHFREVNNIFTPYLVVPFEIECGFNPTICIGPLIDKELARSGLCDFLRTKEGERPFVTHSSIPIRY